MLGRLYLERYRRTQDVRDVDRSITEIREAIAALEALPSQIVEAEFRSRVMSTIESINSFIDARANIDAALQAKKRRIKRTRFTWATDNW